MVDPAAISPGGTTAAVMDLIDARLIELVVSPELLAELDGVLRRDRFRRWLELHRAVEFVAELERLAELADDPGQILPVSPDPEDDYLVALARSTRADALVSGDTDLTHLDLDDLRVLTPRQLVDELAASLANATDGEPT